MRWRQGELNPWGDLLREAQGTGLSAPAIGRGSTARSVPFFRIAEATVPLGFNPTKTDRRARSGARRDIHQ
jgi:hypothetical protein